MIHRINAAIRLVGEGLSSPHIRQELCQRFGVSPIQAYRYLREAHKHAECLPIPEDNAALTVKLPRRIIRRIRGYARHHHLPISEAVTHALEVFLRHRHHGETATETTGVNRIQV
jgi:hypothetical protein